MGQPSVSFQDSPGFHVPHTLCKLCPSLLLASLLSIQDQDLDPHHFDQNTRRHSHTRSTSIPQDPTEGTAGPTAAATKFFTSQSPGSSAQSLPAFIKPVPAKYGVDDIAYLSKKGALTIPSPPLRNALLQSFINFIHPYMPLLDLHEFLDTIENNDESSAVSLLLFQAIMFASTASVDIQYLKAAGYTTRREARRDFFQKTRVR